MAALHIIVAFAQLLVHELLLVYLPVEETAHWPCTVWNTEAWLKAGRHSYFGGLLVIICERRPL